VKTKRTLPLGKTYNERAIALAEHLGIDVPPRPLTGAQFVTLWAEIGKQLLPFEQPEPLTLKQLWAEIGMFLAEQKAPEFQWPPGRPKGTFRSDSKDAKRQRKRRTKKTGTLIDLLQPRRDQR
jgi:hypothetical protein